jgi:hypothetical protein
VRTPLGKLFAFGLADGVVRSMESSKKASEAGPRTIHPSPGPYTIQGQRLLAAPTRAKPQQAPPAPQAAPPHAPATPPVTVAPSDMIAGSDDDFLDSLLLNPRRSGRRFR